MTDRAENSQTARVEIERLRADGLRLISRLRTLARSKDETKEARITALMATDLIWGLSVDSVDFLRKIVTDAEVGKEFRHLRSFLSHHAPRRKEFPILFNELVDLAPYRGLQIGYLLKESKNPKLRGGKSAFSPYALQLVRRLEFLAAEQKAMRLGRIEVFHKSLAYRRYQLDSVPNRTSKLHRDLSEEEFSMRKLIHSAAPEDIELLAGIPPLAKATKDQWMRLSKAFFKKVFPKPEELTSLSISINDSDIIHESQIRAQIVVRIGRAVGALART